MSDAMSDSIITYNFEIFKHMESYREGYKNTFVSNTRV